MKKGAMIGIATIVLIVAIIGLSQNLNPEHVGEGENIENDVGVSSKSDIPSADSLYASTTIPDIASEESHDCSGTAKCMTGKVTKIVDGDTIHVDDQSVRFSLITAPNLEGYGGTDSRDFIQTICPVGTDVLVDEDDGHVLKDHARMVGMVTCNDMVLNKEILDANLAHLEVRFCQSSEFSQQDWAIKHGCTKD